MLMLRQACNSAASADLVSPRMRQSSACTYTAPVKSTGESHSRLLLITGDVAGWGLAPHKSVFKAAQGEASLHKIVTRPAVRQGVHTDSVAPAHLQALHPFPLFPSCILCSLHPVSLSLLHPALCPCLQCSAPAQEGLATVCLVGSSCTLQRARIETNMPRKRGAAAAGYDKALDSFHAKVGSAGAGVAWQAMMPCIRHPCAACTAFSTRAILFGGMGGSMLLFGFP